ncbi:hypothetical protein C7I55_10130 [Sphingomonas deserti]|uniref:Uncharacterized protein n=2 Tax=Allosphingosinicella deserti TaxID=2116704 RepID=A0A2P7QRS8_9SPHN|nr:hypothetical protein C7I55_10130 [Sphingomonas deserti]
MMFRLLAPAALVLALVANPALAASPSPEDLERVQSTSQLIGLSPDGTRIWAEHALASSDFRDWQKLYRIEQAFGEQIALAEPDPRSLVRLTAELAAEHGQRARAKKDGLIAAAFRLSPQDRRTLGAFIVSGADEALKPSRPFAGATELASAWMRMIGVSEEGIKRLVERENRDARPDDRHPRAKIERAIGEQLASPNPSRANLDELVAAYAAEESRLARREKENLTSVALTLSAADRRVIGSFLAEQAAKELAEAKPVLEVLP